MDRTRHSTLGLADHIDAQILKFEGAALAVVRQSVNDMVDIMQTPVAKGGRMRVRTGFLRRSLAAAIGRWPTGPVRGDPDAGLGQYDNGQQLGSAISPTLIAALGDLKLGDTLYIGWTAEYAAPRDALDGFVEAGRARWVEIVRQNCAKVLNGRS